MAQQNANKRMACNDSNQLIVNKQLIISKQLICLNKHKWLFPSAVNTLFREQRQPNYVSASDNKPGSCLNKQTNTGFKRPHYDISFYVLRWRRIHSVCKRGSNVNEIANSMLTWVKRILIVNSDQNVSNKASQCKN